MARFGLCAFLASFGFAACGGSEFSGEQAGGTGAQSDASAGKGGSGGGSGGAQATGGTGGTGGSDGASGSSGTASGGANGTAGASGGTGASGGSSGTTGGTGATGGASGSAGGTSTDASVDAAEPACPTSPPTDPSCTEGASCSYGDHPLADCRDRYVCSGGTWFSTHPPCPPPPACGTLPEFPVIGLACSQHGQDCFVDGGIYCRCAKCPTCTQPEWTCQAPLTPPCPDYLPNIGQPCSHSGGCDYGSCAIESKTRATCDDGAWTWTSVACN